MSCEKRRPVRCDLNPGEKGKRVAAHVSSVKLVGEKRWEDLAVDPEEA